MQWNWNNNKESPYKEELRIWFPAKFQQSLKEEVTPILLKLFQEIERKGKLPYLFYKASITLFLKPNAEVNRKENYKPIFLMNIDAKILKKCWQEELNNISNRLICFWDWVSLNLFGLASNSHSSCWDKHVFSTLVF
jgi:hypothetical protein